MRRPRVPAVAWLLSGGVAVGATVIVVGILRTKGQAPFFEKGDERMFWLTARDLFGKGRGFAELGRASEVPYRYGRAGLPFVAWVLALGRPALVGSTLIGVNLLAITAIPGLAATLLDDSGVSPVGGVLVLLAPGLLVLAGNVVAEPLLIALILLAYLLDRRAHCGAARGVMAYAILVKEVAVLALVPWLWRAFRTRDRKALLALSCTLLPYAAWCSWLSWRVGELPFRAHSSSRTGALGLPFIGIRDVVNARTADYRFIVAIALVTALVSAVAASMARPSLLGGLAGVFAPLPICLGAEALRFEGETIRVLVVPQVFALVALGFALGRRALPPAASDERTRPRATED